MAAARRVMLTEVRVDEGVEHKGKQRAKEERTEGAEKEKDVGLAESVHNWVQHLLNRNDTNVDLVRRGLDVRLGTS